MPKLDLISVLLYFIFAILISAVLFSIFFRLYVEVKFGDKPIEDCPTWAVWMLE